MGRSRLAELGLLLFVASAEAQPLVDHHQHLLQSANGVPQGFARTAKDLIAQMDEAGIGRGVVLSIAYSFSNPNRPALANEYERVMRENDWTRGQAEQYPGRLIVLCSVNPLRDYAVREMQRWRERPGTCKGLKLHFGNSDVDLLNLEHLERVKDVFRTANESRMPVVVHLRPYVDRKRPWGKAQAQVFLEKVLPEAKDIVVQIAHLGGAGSFDASTDEALSVFASAITSKDRRVRRLVFDISGVWNENWGGRKEQVLQRVREIGWKRILFGSDSPLLEAWREVRSLGFTEKEIRKLERNVAVYWK